MTAGLSLDLAKAAMLLRAAYADEEAGLDPCPNFAASRAVIGPGDLFEALGLCLDALMRATDGDPDRLAEALWLDGQLEADADAFATGAAGQ
jgi:hypothetical protein